MLALVAILLLQAVPVRGELAVTGGGGLTSDTYGFGPHLSGRLELFERDVDGGLVASYWGRLLWFPGFEIFWGHEHHLSVRYAFRWFSVGLEAELRNIYYFTNGEWGAPHRLHFGAGPSIGVLAFDDGLFRLEGTVSYLPLATTFDPHRLSATVDFSWRSFTVRALGGLGGAGMYRPSPPFVMPHLGLYVGWRTTW
ncbi:MAG: hypothetical protein Q8L48_43650 [Archangium sp.]|nr:hypothetical protein [Archangium sp.]